MSSTLIIYSLGSLDILLNLEIQNYKKISLTRIIITCSYASDMPLAIALVISCAPMVFFGFRKRFFT